MQQFDEFRLDPARRLLVRDEEVVHLTPKAFDILLVLAEKQGALVTKDDLMKAVWTDSFVEESNLTQTIFVLRKTLDDGNRQRYIMTVPGKGYRFVPELKSVSGNGHAPSPAVTHGRPAMRYWREFAAICLMAALALSLYFRLRTHPTQADEVSRLAVLPFENLTGDPAQDYIADGLTEELIARVGRVDPGHIGVIARTSAMHYQQAGKPLAVVGRELEVQYVLEGSVRLDSGNVRITTQLVRVSDQRALWSGQYERAPDNLLALQSDVAREVSSEVQLALGRRRLTDGGVRDSPHPPNSSAVYELYLKGRYFWNKRTAVGLRQAIAYFQQAADADPNYAEAYAGLAESYALMSGYSSAASPAEFMPKARAAALHALELDPQLAEAHTARAVIAQDYDWDWQTAEQEYRRAIELDPNNATSHHWYAECLALQGRFDDAFPEIERAHQLDPLSLIIATDYGAILYFSRQYDRAIERFRAVLDMDPTFPRAHLLTYAYAQKSQYSEALADSRQLRPADNPWKAAMSAYVYGRSGQKAQARRSVQELERLGHASQIDPMPFIVAYVGINDKDRAFAYLRLACEHHSSSLTAIKVDPIYDPLRNDPRFQKFLRQLGLT
jgi:TolB-like protein/DNA-binding winged helix-turn-helix (wHTH) protein/Tfp pilus assembly protein PilF